MSSVGFEATRSVALSSFRLSIICLMFDWLARAMRGLVTHHLPSSFFSRTTWPFSPFVISNLSMSSDPPMAGSSADEIVSTPIFASFFCWKYTPPPSPASTTTAMRICLSRVRAMVRPSGEAHVGPCVQTHAPPEHSVECKEEGNAEEEDRLHPVLLVLPGVPEILELLLQ